MRPWELLYHKKQFISIDKPHNLYYNLFWFSERAIISKISPRKQNRRSEVFVSIKNFYKLFARSKTTLLDKRTPFAAHLRLSQER